MINENTCICCGKSIPEGRQVCKQCDTISPRRTRMTIVKAKELLDEEYARANELKYVRNPLAYALYQVWKKADAEGVTNEKYHN